MNPHPLRVERELRGWSQARVAEAVGTNVRSVQRWERGHTYPYPYYRERLCALFGKNARELGLISDSEGHADVSIPQQADSLLSVIPALTLPSPDDLSSPGQFLSVPPTFAPLLGREQEIEEIKKLLITEEARLLTLVGMGGVGKTRLSIQLAHELRPHFPDGICFVSLAAESDPQQVMRLIAHALHLQDENGLPFQWVQMALRKGQWLLVLDNFERVVRAAPELELLVGSCPCVKVLVTSRVVLRLPSETQYRLLPLAVPPFNPFPDREALAAYPSFQLFLQRVRTLLPAFQVTESNAAAIAEICVRLDGVPLSIELAAARIKVLPPHALLPRLSRSLDMLTKGSPTGPERQHTLRSTLQWSYNLLSASEQRFFRLLSLFVGGFTVEAAEALFATVMGEDRDGVSSALDGLDALIDNSLLQPALSTDDDRESRLHVLETIREFGRERLLESSDVESAQRAHASYYLRLAEAATPELQKPQRGKWLDQLDRERGNFQAAMEWMLERQQGKVEEKQAMAVNLSNALGRFWIARGYLNEGWRFLQQVLQVYEEGNMEIMPPLARAYLGAASLCMRLGDLERAQMLVERGIRYAGLLEDDVHLAEALRLAGWLAHQRGQGERAFDFYQQCLAIFRKLDDKQGITNTMHNMAFVLQTRGDYGQACHLLEEVVLRQRTLHNKAGISGALYQLAQVLFGAEEHPPLVRIHALLREGLVLAEEAGDQRTMASIKGLLGWVVSGEGKLDEARGLVEECLRFYRKGGDREIYGQYLGTLGEIATEQGDFAGAQSIFEESMQIGRELGERSEVTAVALEGMARLAMVQGSHSWAVQLWAKARWWRETIEVRLMPGQLRTMERWLAQLRALLGEKPFTDLWEGGRTLSLDEVWLASPKPLPTGETNVPETWLDGK